VSLADATRVADSAFSTWNDAQCAGGAISVQAYDDGPITSLPDASYLAAAGTDASTLSQWAACSDSADCNPQAHDVIVFDDDQWPYNDPANTLALTTITFGLQDGKIFEAYTEVNSAEHLLTTSEPPTGPSGTYDLQAILTHEAGHFFGLAHATDDRAIMYAFYQPGAITLAPDDLDAICTVYPAHQASGGCSCAMAQNGSGPAPLTGLLFVLLATIGRKSSTGWPTLLSTPCHLWAGDLLVAARA
jgi:MYXO-CTERM domain-containing protein